MQPALQRRGEEPLPPVQHGHAPGPVLRRRPGDLALFHDFLRPVQIQAPKGAGRGQQPGRELAQPLQGLLPRVGQVVQQGNHDALVEAEGKYQALWEAQAQYYAKKAAEAEELEDGIL